MGTGRRGPSRSAIAGKTRKGKGRSTRQKKGQGRGEQSRSQRSRKVMRGSTRQREKKKEIGSLAEFFEEFDDDGQFEEYEGGVDYE